MYKIQHHPILEIPEEDSIEFIYEGKKIKGQRGKTIAAALHQAGFPVHSHSIDGRNRTLQCGIGKCGACEMLVDGVIRRICITNVDDVHEVQEIPQGFVPSLSEPSSTPQREVKIYKTTVCIVGAGPAGLACREQLNKLGIPNLVVDSNARIGGQFNMQTHQFFFFEKEQKFGGMRGFDIARTLAGDNEEGILLNHTVWDLLEGRRIAVKNIVTQEVSYIDAEQLVVATGAVPFMPTFENDDVPGVYTAAVFQKMMNQEHTLLGKRVLTVGAGNIGYLTSYQGMQAGATIKAIIEGMDHEGGFPVQANRVRRLGIPILTSHVLLKAIPNESRTGITGAVIAQCKNFQPIAGTETVIDDIDIINICTGLIPDSQILTKGKQVFGSERTYGCGDAVRIGEGTSAVLRGKQAAYEIAQSLGVRYDYDEYLSVSRDYIDSQQRPVRVLNEPTLPDEERMSGKPFVVADCLYGFACNPCTFSCPSQAISKPTTHSVPVIDYTKCIGCMTCVSRCPGLAIFGYDLKKGNVFLPVEYSVEENEAVWLVDDNGKPVGEGVIERVLKKANKTDTVRVHATDISGKELTRVHGFLRKSSPLSDKPHSYPLSEATDTLCKEEGPKYVCHCEDVTLKEILDAIGNRKFISVDELKHITRMGMGPCRGKRCVPRARQILRAHGIELTSDSFPRAPLASPVTLGDVYTEGQKEVFVLPEGHRKISCEVLVAGGGAAGSSAFRYFAEAGKKTILVNYDRGSSWRCIAGGRPAFSNPAITDIANHNLELFRDIQKHYNINFKMTRYVNLVHDDATYRALDASRAWSDAYMIDRKDFKKVISPYWNNDSDVYSAALISNNCWQATPGRTIDYLRGVAVEHGGVLMEDCELLHVERIEGNRFRALVHEHGKQYVEITCEHFVNSMGWASEKFTDMLGIDTQLYPVKHQAFITRRLPNMGANGDSLDMIIDRRHYKGFCAVYGQQFFNTGQIIGCASPDCDSAEANKNIKFNSQEFLQIVSEVFADWIPSLRGVGFHAVWAGYYIEPRYIVDPDAGLLTGLRGHGFMLSQYLAKIYVDKYLGRPVPDYMKDLALTGNGLAENAFK
ncbi:MAG: FAD-dependent oxidoreductase [Bacteroidaceae bacterium]|nr:FAD-dependent oxidoreductase [Bacteroidaceae bacterium]